MSQLEGGKRLMASGGWRPQHPTVPRMVPNKENLLQTSVALRNPMSQETDYIISKPPEEKELKRSPPKANQGEVSQGKN